MLQDSLKKFDEKFDLDDVGHVTQDRVKQFWIEEIKGILEGLRMEEKLPYYARLCQNQNGLEYCGTCEQVWELCSCAARNTGYKKAVQEINSAISALLDTEDEGKEKV